MRRFLSRQVRHAATLVFLTSSVAGCARTANAATVTLAWDSNRESDLAGYVVAYGTQSGQLTSTVDVGNHTSYQFTNLETGRTYFFAVRAYNTAGVMSALSAEVNTANGSAQQLSLTNLLTNLTAPQAAGTRVIFAAGASGGTPPYQYEWFVSDGSTFTMARNWSGDNTFTWQPQKPNLAYTVKVRARSATNTADAPETPQAERSVSFAIKPVEPR
jgi:hypothetical protein